MNMFNLVILTVVLAFLISLVLAIPVMLLWDWLMPELFGLKEITLFQAWGLSLLTSLLFKSHITSKRD